MRFAAFAPFGRSARLACFVPARASTGQARRSSLCVARAGSCTPGVLGPVHVSAPRPHRAAVCRFARFAARRRPARFCRFALGAQALARPRVGPLDGLAARVRCRRFVRHRRPRSAGPQHVGRAGTRRGRCQLAPPTHMPMCLMPHDFYAVPRDHRAFGHPSWEPRDLLPQHARAAHARFRCAARADDAAEQCGRQK